MTLLKEDSGAGGEHGTSGVTTSGTATSPAGGEEKRRWGPNSVGADSFARLFPGSTLNDDEDKKDYHG